MAGGVGTFVLPVRWPMLTVHSLAQVPSAWIFFRKALTNATPSERRTRELGLTGALAQHIEQQRVVGHVGFDTALAQGIEGFLVRLEFLHDGLGRKLRKDGGAGRSGLGGGPLAGEIVIRLDRLVVRLDQHACLRAVVRPGKGNLLGARRGDGIRRQHHVHLVIDEHLLARGRGHLREFACRPA